MKLSSGMETLGLKYPPEGRTSTLYLQLGQTFVTQSPRKITTIVGSCVAVLLWSSRFRIGGATHYLLPEWNQEGEPSARYGNIALEGLLKDICRMGASVSDLHAYIYGGASILESLQTMSGNLGTRNVEVALDFLRAHPQITLCDRNTGGKKGRKICFDTFEGTAAVQEIG